MFSWSRSFLAQSPLGSKFLGFLVSKFRGFKVSKIYEHAMSCLLEDIDPISNIFNLLLGGSSVLFGACLFHFVQSCRLQRIRDL